MNKLFYVLIVVSALFLVIGCLTTGKIDWDIKGDKLGVYYEDSLR